MYAAAVTESHDLKAELAQAREVCKSLILSIFYSIHVGGIDLEARAIDAKHALAETKEGG